MQSHRQNAQPNNNGTVQTVGNPVRGVFGNGYTLTYTFENGFGGIGAGMPGRMNNVLVSAGPKGSGNSTDQGKFACGSESTH